MRHADDGVHGGANFVAHIGQKVGLHAGGILCKLFGRAHEFGGLAFFTHIVKHPNRAQRKVIGVDCAAADSAPKPASVFATHFLRAVVNLAALNVLIGPFSERHLRWIPDTRRLTHKSTQRPAKQFVQTVVGAYDAPLFDEGDTQCRGVKNCGLLIIDLANGAFNALLLRNVAHGSNDQSSFIIFGNVARHINVKPNAIAAGELGLKSQWASGIPQLLDHGLRIALGKTQQERRGYFDAHDVLGGDFHQSQSRAVGIHHRQSAGVRPEHGL